MLPPPAAAIPIGSAAWVAWLTAPSTTSFRFSAGAVEFTARREPKPGGRYWYAYRRHGGRLHKRYLGRDTDLTQERLMATAALLAQPDPPPSATPPAHPNPSPPALPDLILTTKLQMPPTRPTLVPRPRLLQRLSAGLGGQLSLISAPAGFGKTTLLSEWLRAAPPRGPGRPSAWLTLDAGDSTPLHFLRYLIAGLTPLAPDASATLYSLVQGPQPPPLPVLLTSLVNALAALPEPSILVLDDYHTLQGAPVHEILTFLVDHQPAALHLVIATREDPPLPLARLRARQELTELRAADLRCTPDEATAFLRSVMGLDLTSAQIAALDERTEGWIAGLQLAALSLRDDTQASDFIAAFTGSNRYILDYLIDEVVSRQPAAIQDFLIRTAVLDRLCAPLCAAVLGAPATVATTGALLQQIERANLFLTPLDTQRRWYRYHPLFADLLRAQLQHRLPDDVPSLHHRASIWYEQAGLPAGAVGHALAAPDFGRAAQLIEQNAESLWMQGELTTLQDWLAALPPAILAARPRLLLTQAWTEFLRSIPPLEAVKALLAAAERALAAREPAADNEQAELRGILAAIQAALGNAQHEPARTILQAREALALLPPGAVYWRIAALIDLGRAFGMTADWTAASQALEEARTQALAAGNHYTALVATVHLARSFASQGRQHEAATLYRAALAHAAQPGVHLLPHTGPLAIALAQILYEEDRLPEAARLVEEGLERGRHGQPGILLDGITTAALIAQAQGDPGGAQARLEEAAEIARTTGVPQAVAFTEAYWVRLWLIQGRPVEGAGRAARWVDAHTHPEDSHLPGLPDLEQRILARLYLAEGQPERALLVLERLAQEAAPLSWRSRTEIGLLRALAWQARGAPSEVEPALREALHLAESAGYIRLLVDLGQPLAALLREWQARQALPPYGARVLTHFGATPGAAGPLCVPGPPLEPLTEREREVLRLLAAGLSGPAIAAALVVGPSTVKTHLKRIYGKLDAHSRDQAIARAAEHGLL